jgi:26S proteasome regulatory subunit N8
MSSTNQYSEVIVHPVILLSIVDHYHRLAKETTRRVVGVLLGEYVGDKIEVTNCYAIPFEEDPKDKKVWFVDHIYNETMFEMHQKINYKEIIVGWYSSGPKIRPHDIEINDVFRKYTPSPVFCVIDVQEKNETLGIPAEAFVMKEEVDIDGQLIKTFEKISTSIKASLPEQIGVEFLLKDIDEHSNSTLIKQAKDKVTSIKALIARLVEVRKYLLNVINKKLVPNPLIISNIQELFNYLPNYETEDIVKALSNQTNDNYLILYLSWMMKTTMGLHKLINNKILLKESDKQKEESKEEDKKKDTKTQKETKEIK